MLLGEQDDICEGTKCARMLVEGFFVFLLLILCRMCFIIN